LYSAFICELFSFIPSPDTVLIPEYFDHVTEFAGVDRHDCSIAHDIIIITIQNYNYRR